MTRSTIVAGNWKMNLGRQESVDLARGVAGITFDSSQTEVLIFPATAWIAPVADALNGSQVRVGGQNCHSASKGAFTGEVSAPMLAEMCTDVMVGHSERRHVFGETDEQTSAKVRAVLDAGLRAVLCVGETLEEREAGNAKAVVGRQLKAGLSNVEQSEIDRIIIAYEPVWAIGTGVAATAADAQSMCTFVRMTLEELFGAEGAARHVLYGGSVTPENAVELFGQADIDGGLVGRASLDVQSFRSIVEAGQSSR